MTAFVPQSEPPQMVANVAPKMVASRQVITDLPPVANSVLPVANPEVATRGKKNNTDDFSDDLLDEFFGVKNSKIDEVAKGWRLETNSDGRLRWRYQVKDDAGVTVTYVKSDGSTGYARGSSYVGITQAASAKETDSRRVKGKHKPRRRGKTTRKYGRRHDGT